MKTLKEKHIASRLVTALSAVSLMTIPAFAANTEAPTSMAQVLAPIVALLNTLLKPLLAVVVAVGGLYCVLLGVKYAKAEEPQDREKAKSHLKNAVLGFVLIFVLIVVMNLLVPVMETWVNNTMIANGGSAIF